MSAESGTARALSAYLSRPALENEGFFTGLLCRQKKYFSCSKIPLMQLFTASGGFAILLLQFRNGDAIFSLAVTAKAERGHIPVRTQTVSNGSAEHTGSLAMNDTDRF